MNEDKPIGKLEVSGDKLTESERQELIDLMAEDKSMSKIIFTDECFTISLDSIDKEE